MQLIGHINEDQVMALYLGELTGDEEQRLHRHLSDCPGCNREFSLYREILSGVETLVRQMGGAQAQLLRAAIKTKMREKQIYYEFMQHPLTGPMLVAVTARGVCLIQFTDKSAFEVEEMLRQRQPEVWIKRDQLLTAAMIQELQLYLQRKLSRFTIPIDWRLVTSEFQRQVLQLTSRIPYGQVYTYGEIAQKLGKPKSARAVGQALGANPIPIVVPCHRVLASSGKLGGYSGRPGEEGLKLKRRLLQLEGVRWPGNGRHLARQIELFTDWIG
ncbi:MAG: methylated-DNA--[protein]-cysteine S-methyltransferase [candidate division KSB1 bacterium]|nr:methylated-DNA--[protein]-cysteine S-methyltransferase [candidate division KSB1 bacterium]MDZ7302123.1 methylated-DNA--[protein]-cysteine S-methyltransferase [candidate division KSB1 bacterium]MDZ7311233.1 methylated-DNA--[protein]-cysteine S-methyltransferase [candidate division KSB1 bacterium]